MDVFQAIRQRCSVRNYAEKTPTSGDILKVLEAGRWAPSGLNNQPWRYTLVADPRVRAQLARLTTSDAVIRSAPCLILICLDLNASYNRDKDLMAIGAFIQNMLLEAYDLGLGTCWLGEIVNRKNEVTALMKWPPHLDFVAGVAIGYPDEEIGERERRTLDELEIR
jgi:nitroreductase